MNGAASTIPPPDGGDEQFRLLRIQAYNWGTFDGRVDVSVASTGYLFVGPSGSGKSTLLDAHAALLTPPRWVDFNVAAREAERHGKDRNLMTYLRGAWAQQTSEEGEHVAQYLRSGTTWSAVAETYGNARGEVVVLAQVLWVRGNSTAASDVRKLYLVLRRPFELRELEFFPKHDFEVRRFKSELPDAFVKDEFSPYQERFRALLGIESERALRLLHKTQSAKNLGDLNVFLRDFMLDPPETFLIADRLVSEFGELNAAHQAVVAAKRQIETLVPARAAHDDLERQRQQKSVLDELGVGLDAFCEQQRAALLGRRIEELTVQATGLDAEASVLRSAEERERQKLIELDLRRQGLGGGLLEQLENQLGQCQAERPRRETKRSQMGSACQALGWAFPESAGAFAQRVADARSRLLAGRASTAELVQRRDVLKERQRETETAFAEVRGEIAAMERQRSNIPARMLAVRAAMAEALCIAEEQLPFAGELIEVKKEAQDWRGAIERVLHGFAQSLLVDDRQYAAVSSYLNDHHIGERLVYFRTLPHGDRRTPGPSSLFRKLDIAPDAHSAWLRDELANHFDYDCANTLTELRNSSRAITREGQIKHSGARHEKDDRRRVDDRSRWVLGFDNKEKLELYKTRAADLGGQLARLGLELDELRDEGDRQQQQLFHCQTLSNMTWDEIDIAALLAQIESIQGAIERETRERPELAELDAEVEAQKRVHGEAVESLRQADGRRHAVRERIERHRRTLDGLGPEHLSIRLTTIQREGLDQRIKQASKPLALETVDALKTELLRRLAGEVKGIELSMLELKNQIERRFADFNRQWPAESGGLDATLASAEDYFVKLTRLETDGLPRYEDRFLELLREQSDQNLTLLSHRLDQERSAIKARLTLVNESLLTAEFSPGTHLVIDAVDKLMEEVRTFQQSLRDALSHSFRPGDDRELAEQRFVVLSELVRRFASQETPDKNWKSLVLDVRQHVEFVARELDADDKEVEVYRSGAGKSGGQRQKLAATCLAAALRYQLGGQDRALPCFATVVLDEAFDKADAEFTTMAMNIFKTFGFQMVVATPLKSVMTLEPFIGGACFVHIKDRKSSSILTIDYDEARHRLVLPDSIGQDPEAATA